MYPHQHQQPMYNNYGGYPFQQQQQPPVQQQFIQQQQQQQISVKVKYRETIRRFTVPSTCALNEFYQHVSKSFQLEINASTHLVQYKDNEDDLIVTTSEEEWTYAKNSFSTPCMQVTLKDKVVQKKEVKKEVPVTLTQKPSSPQKQPETVSNQTIQSPKLPTTTTQNPIQTQPLPVVTLPQPSNPATVMEDSLGFVALNTSQQPSPFVARFSSDVNLPDGSAIYVNQQITKTWKVVNPGSTPWPSNVQLHCRDSKTLPFEIVYSTVPVAAPNQSVEVSVAFIPRKVGPLKGYFKLCSGEIQFGHTFWLDLVVHQLPVAEAPQQQDPTINQTIQQVRDLKIDDIKEFDSDDEDSDDEETSNFEDERFNALKEKYQFQLDVLSNMGMTNQKTLVNILEQNSGDVSATIQQFILLSSKME